MYKDFVKKYTSFCHIRKLLNIKSKQFIIDVYDLSTKNYKYSVVAYNKQLENNIDINRVYADSLSIYLETRKGYYQLTD